MSARSNLSEKELDIAYLSRLAALRIDEKELRRAKEDLGRIIQMIEAMRAVDTDGIEPLAHPLEAGQRLREDRVSESPDPEALQARAPLVREGFYLVPRVVE